VFEQFLSEHRTYEEALKAVRKAIQSHNGQDRKIVVDRVAEYDPRRERAPARVYIIGQGGFQWIDIVPHEEDPDVSGATPELSRQLDAEVWRRRRGGKA
jgi:hypothetical protein